LNRADSDDPTIAKTQVACLNIFTKMINQADPDDVDENLPAYLYAEVVEKKREERENIQNKLGELGAMNAAIDLIHVNVPSIVKPALTLCVALLAGGNNKLQKKMMAHFLSSPDHHFFEDIRDKIAFQIADTKQQRQQASLLQKRKTIEAFGE
jgi:hypothetical protein